MKATEELSDKALRQRIRDNERVLDEIERADPAEVVRAGKADESIERAEAALARGPGGGGGAAERAHHSLPAGSCGAGHWSAGGGSRTPPRSGWRGPAAILGARTRGRDAGRRPAHRGGRRALETLVKRKRNIASDEHAEPLTEAETAEWERLLGKAAGDETCSSGSAATQPQRGSSTS